MTNRIDPADIAKLLDFNAATIKVWLQRAEFTKYAIKDNFFGRLKVTYRFDEVFKLNFITFLRNKGYKDKANKFCKEVKTIIKKEET